jgi:hypothetical protein
MMAGLVILIVMGIIGGTPEIRGVVVPIAFTISLVGFLAFLYSKWVEQGVIREAAAAVRKVLEDVVNPHYTDSPHRIRWVVRHVGGCCRCCLPPFPHPSPPPPSPCGWCRCRCRSA